MKKETDGRNGCICFSKMSLILLYLSLLCLSSFLRKKTTVYSHYPAKRFRVLPARTPPLLPGPRAIRDENGFCARLSTFKTCNFNSEPMSWAAVQHMGRERHGGTGVHMLVVARFRGWFSHLAPFSHSVVALTAYKHRCKQCLEFDIFY